MDRLPGDDRVGPGEVDVLEHAHVGQAPAVVPDGPRPAVLNHHHLAGVQLPFHSAPYRLNGAGLRGEEHSITLPAHAQGAEAPGVPAGDELLGRHDQQGEGPAQVCRGTDHRLLYAGAPQPLLSDGVGDQFRVTGGVEDGSLVLKGAAQLVDAHQVAVVNHRQGALHILDGQGLGVLPLSGPGSGIADVAYRHGAVEPVQDVL